MCSKLLCVVCQRTKVEVDGREVMSHVKMHQRESSRKGKGQAPSPRFKVRGSRGQWSPAPGPVALSQRANAAPTAASGQGCLNWKGHEVGKGVPARATRLVHGPGSLKSGNLRT